MEFASFDDDLFQVDHQRSIVVEEYSARVCDDCWFMRVSSQDLVSTEDELAALKYTADYLFHTKTYNDAVVKYEDILCVLPPGNTVTKRECLESLARCHIRKGTPQDAVIFAEKLHGMSKNVDQMTVSCTVLVDTYLATGQYSDALSPAQTLVTLHGENYHMWIKLCYVYACVYKISLHEVEELVSSHLIAEAATTSGKNENSHSIDNTAAGGQGICELETLSSSSVEPKVKISQITLSSDKLAAKTPCGKSVREITSQCASKHDKLSNQKNCRLLYHNNQGVQYVAACLHRAGVILRKTEGTAVGFALQNNLMYQKKLQQDLLLLLDEDSLSQLKSKVYENDSCQHSVCLVEVEDTLEFVDLGSSKFKSNNKDESDATMMPQSNFERQWFPWIKT